jgi:hypothetical protein
MSFTGNEEHSVTLAAASAMTKNYRDTVSANATIAHYFGKSELQSLLNQDGCVGVRAYYAITSEGAKQLVLVGVNSSENDLYEGIILDRSLCCPIYCSSANPLNTTPTTLV